jgi:hypothetical protein
VTATSSCPSSSTSTCDRAASSADELWQQRPDDAQQLESFVRVPCLRDRPIGQLPLTHPGLTQLRQRHPDDAQQLQGLARLFGKPACVGITLLMCDLCSHSEQESALVRGDVG